jgi:hypothetical protein
MLAFAGVVVEAPHHLDARDVQQMLGRVSVSQGEQ